MIFHDYSSENAPSYADLENAGPVSVTAADIEAERLMLVQRYKCDAFEMTYEFEPLTEEVCDSPEDMFNLLTLKFIHRKYVDGVLSSRVVSERVILVPEHISLQARKIRLEQGEASAN
jgi:hypothetical protein